jgi:hypothetical protein
MQNANDFAQAAVAIGQLADRFKPADGDQYAALRNLTVFHLRSAASHARAIADDLTKKQEAANAG